MTTEDNKRPKLADNTELIDDAGEVHLEPPQMWGKGIINEFKNTVGTHWFEEMTNLNQRTIAVSLLMFISVLPPTLAFGANYGKMSGNRMGTVETILATSYIGVVYSLIGGMPMCIIGSTGPALAISTAIRDISENAGVPYLTFNAWISIWLFGYCCLCSFFDINRYVKLATRFTDEIFALLIVVIFVVNAIYNPFGGGGLLRYIEPEHKSHGKYEDDPDYDYMSVGLLSIIIGFGTCALIFWFRSFKFSSYFCGDGVRSNVHDFAVTTSVIIFSMVKELGFPDIQTEQLNVPERFEPSFKCCDSSCETNWPTDCPEIEEAAGTRNWFVDLFDCPGWVPFAAAGPAIMGFLLCYLDCGITWHLINHKHNKLTHGDAYNYDLCLVGLFNMFNGLMGLPWLVATTVPCIVHLNALADKDKDGNIVEVQQTRLTMFLSHLLLGLSLLFLNALKLIPFPVLLGVFLFMGLSALPGIEFWNRGLLWLQQPSKYPETVFTKYMKKSRIHKYTVIQTLFFFLIYGVMNVKAISILFPFMTFLCIPSRLFLLPKFFAGWELTLLDGEEDQIHRWVEAKQESLRKFELETGDKTGYMSEDNDSYENNNTSASAPEPIRVEVPEISC